MIWLEAFASHPQIGEKRAEKQIETATGQRLSTDWSSEEQSGVQQNPADVTARLLVGNRAYRQRFGYIYIVCATGKTAPDMLAILERRLQNYPSAELIVAEGEQRRITHLRLEKLLAKRSHFGESWSAISTHVLDTARGRPAAGISISLEMREGSDWTQLAQTTADENGRSGDLMPSGLSFERGTYRLRFDVVSYFRKQNVETFFRASDRHVRSS